MIKTNLQVLKSILAENITNSYQDLRFYCDTFNRSFSLPYNDTEESFDPLLLSTSSGLFLFINNKWINLFNTPGYGICSDFDNNFYCVCNTSSKSYIVKFTININKQNILKLRPSLLTSFYTRYHGDRLHQISWDKTKNCLLCANTRRNSLLWVDSITGDFLDEVFLVNDRFDYPIRTDNNHVNAVCEYNGFYLFAMHTLGQGSGLGFLDKKNVNIFSFPGRGVHDILIHNEHLLFTDSFRSAIMKDNAILSGSLMVGGQAYLQSLIESFNQQFVVRGISIVDSTIYLGSSAYAKRNNRFLDKGGGFFAFNSDSLKGFRAGPFSQVYDIQPLFYSKIPDPPFPLLNADLLFNLFESEIGPCIYSSEHSKDLLTPKLV